MRNMSFALTTKQIVDGSKTVTRRIGWLMAKQGQLIQPVEKCMGLRPGEKMVKLRDPMIIVSIRREPLERMIADLDYGFDECRLEGFEDHPAYKWPSEFVAMFCSTHKGCSPKSIITRILLGEP